MQRINSLVKHEVRKGLCNKFDGKCAYCRKDIGMRGTVDHYIPQALGGTNAKGNLRWCCTECNGLKGDMPPEQWEQRMPEPIKVRSKSEQRMAAHRIIAERVAEARHA